jgi:hypothetical protein
VLDLLLIGGLGYALNQTLKENIADCDALVLPVIFLLSFLVIITLLVDLRIFC